MSRLQVLYHLSIAVSLLVTITEKNNGLYKTISDDLYNLVNKEAAELGNSYVSKLKKYRSKAFENIKRETDIKVVNQLIIDNLSAAIVAWDEIKTEKYQNYTKTLSKHLNSLSYYWRNSLEEDAQEKAFGITDEIMEQMFKEEV